VEPEYDHEHRAVHPRPATVLMAGQVPRKSFDYDHPLKPPKSNRLWH